MMAALKYHLEYHDPFEPESQRWNIWLTRPSIFAVLCARGDLNPHVLADTGT
jgi:hypothetical protein